MKRWILVQLRVKPESAGVEGECKLAQNPTFVITMQDGRQMKGELYPDIAPQSVGNFISLANSGFYDGVCFHRVIPGFMIQGGDPKGIGIGGPGYCIKGEFAANGFSNPLKHTYGVLSMARSMMPNSAGSQFFIMTSDSPHLDGQYAAFGKVLEGMEVADAIVSTKRDMRDKPLVPQVMASVRVETYGETYPFEKL
ncbi:MAG: peptidylprolyl isomerase [Clostridia bacterium]|nr:peptidylprolyl isomerase [Clostridia bacterium]